MDNTNNVSNINKKKIILSGIQPSGNLNIGTYFGAIKNWVNLQNDYINYFCVVDMHAITVRQEPAQLRRRSLEVAATYIACGIDPGICTLFIQSHVPAHAQLSWVLSCYSMFGELSRMTQFKEKSEQHTDNINAGLFTYPVLMAADILIYNAHLVPVGADQKQHLELARDIAVRFNSVYGDVFTIPEPYIPKDGAKIYSLQEPDKKMSKSDSANENSSVFIMDKKDDIIRKFKRAVTDSEAEVRFAGGKDGINNLMSIYSCATGKNFDETEKEFAGRGYGDFKLAVGEAVAEVLAPIQKRFYELMDNKDVLEKILRDGADKAAYAANKTLSKVYKKIGFLQI
ncbi:MAG: tryptophan--tRNA ligase [Oscillospiraceae bacterium]|nr:tryptophan--tRNA ligase [Oscillospiraceae bacterium]